MSKYDNSKQKDVGLWEKTSQAGNPYYFGKNETHKFVLFPNNSQNPKAPAYKLLVSPLDDAPRNPTEPTDDGEDLPF